MQKPEKPTRNLTPTEIYGLAKDLQSSEAWMYLVKPKLEDEIKMADEQCMNALTGEQALAWAKYKLALHNIENLWFPEWYMLIEDMDQGPSYGGDENGF